VFRGIKGIGEPTFDPFVEATWALDSGGRNFPSHLDLILGVENRPLARNVYFDNFNYEGLHLLRFMRSWRFFVQYLERKNLTDEILGARDSDFQFGTSIFYEWGVALDEPWLKPERDEWSDWVNDYSWGEYFGSYKYIKSNVGSVDSFNSWVLNSSLILGVKWPSFKLPRNPINDELLLMPYFRFEHTTNPRRSEITGDNRILLIAGVRWMPFRSYQFQDNEWLSLTKFFAEYVGIGGSQHPGAAEGVTTPRRDWIIGIKTSYRRF
jgi:hypothetical protein